MAPLRFLDTTVLINFTLMARHDLLTWFLQGKGAWCLSVSREAKDSATLPGLGGLAAWSELLGAPLIPEHAELLDAKAMAARMLKPGQDQRRAHMGEAETLAIITRRDLSALFLTDDHDAARVANLSGVSSVSTTRILANAVVADRIEQYAAKQLLAGLLNQDRVMGNPPSPMQFDEFVRTLRSRSATR